MKSSQYRLIKILLSLVFGLMGIAMLIVALLPTIVSTEWGQNNLIQIVNDRIPGTLTTKHISLNWFGTQKVEGLVLLDPKGETVISIESFVTDTPLYTLLTKGLNKGTTKISSLDALILRGSTGKTNLEESLGQTAFPIFIPSNHSISLTDVNATIQYLVGEFTIQAAGQTRQGNVSGAFQVDLQRKNEEMQWSADVSHFPVDILDAFVSMNQPEMAGVLRNLLGEAINLRVNETSQGTELNFDLNAQSPHLSAAVNGKISNGILRLTSPAKVTLKATPELLTALNVEWRLLGPVDTELNLHRLNLPLEFLSSEISYEQLNDFAVQADIRLSEAVFSQKDELQSRTRAQNFIAKVEAPANSNTLAVHLEGLLSQGNEPIKIVFDTKTKKPGNLNQWISQLCEPSELQIALEHIPSSTIDDLLGLEGKVVKGLGKEFSLRILSTSQDPRHIRLSLMSELVSIPHISLKVDQTFQFGEDFLNRKYSGHLSVKSFSMKNKQDGAAIHSLEIPWNIEKGMETVAASFSGEVAQGKGQFEGHIKLRKLQSSKFPSVNCLLKGQKIPVKFLELFSGRSELEPLFGKMANLDFAIDLNNLKGPINVSLNGEKGSLYLRSHYSNDALTLLKPFVVETQATPQLGKIILGEFSPVFRELNSADNTLKLTVHPDKFSLPLTPFDIDKVNIGSAVMEMGKLQFHNSGEVKKLLNVLGPVRSEQISVWATPLYVSVDRGVLTIYRVDMLVMNRYPIATWGTIDFVRDNIDMTIGITGRAIANAKNLEKVNPDIMVQIPYRGHPIKKAKIDAQAAMTRIGAVVAKSSSVPEAIVLGTVFEFANGKQDKVPAPTTSPLPWKDSEISAENDQKSSGHKKNDKHHKEGLNPLKDIKKEASKLKILDELLQKLR
ncbi:MAG: hypothetical protein ACE5GN_00575 [Waddliaceae bacterium]